MKLQKLGQNFALNLKTNACYFLLNAEQYVQLAGFQRHEFLCWIVNIIQSHVLLSAHFIVLQIFNLCCVVAISLAMADDLEPGHTNGVDNGSPIRKKLHISHLRTHRHIHTHDIHHIDSE